MLNTILFDLDGTLLPMNYDCFAKTYFTGLEKATVGLMAPGKLSKAIMQAVENLAHDSSSDTNEIKFYRAFEAITGLNREKFDKYANVYYEKNFDECEADCKRSTVLLDALKVVKDKGYTVALATNPLFPKIAVLKRMEWAGLKLSDFEHISSFEDDSFCKPQKEYFLDILKKLNKEPSECLMVGNDMQEDAVAATAGIDTYIITDYIIDRKNTAHTPKYMSNSGGFFDFAAALPTLLG